MNTMPLDPRIGELANGQFYAFVNGFNKPELVGSRAQIELALGVHSERVSGTSRKRISNWTVTLTFQYPAWDERMGIVYSGISAVSKSEANRQARKHAEADGHAVKGRGRYWFSAQEED